MLSAMKARRRSPPAVIVLLGAVALLLVDCSSDNPIHVTTEVPLSGVVVPTDILCNESGGTTTATGHSAGPAHVVLALTVHDASGRIVGSSPTVARVVPSGSSWNWTLRAHTGASAPTGCTVSTLGSTRPAAAP